MSTDPTTDPTGAPASGPDVLLGRLGAATRAAVGPSGRVRLGGGGPALEWWIGAEDRWHLPRTSVTVRQHRIDHTPVVETAMRVPGGDVVHRTFVAAGSEFGPDGTDGTDGDTVVIEVENRSGVPVALALVVTAEASTPLTVVGSTVAGGDRPVLVLDRAPAHVAVASGPAAAADVEAIVTSGRAEPPPPGGAARANGVAGPGVAALVVPLAHTAVVRAVLPLRSPAAAPAGRRRVRGDGGTAEPVAAAFPARLPDAAGVARGWLVHAERGARIVLPAGRAADALATARIDLLLAAGDGTGIAYGPDRSDGADRVAGAERVEAVVETAATVLALDRLGLHPEAAALVGTLLAGQTLAGSFVPARAPGALRATAVAVAAAARHPLLAADPEAADDLYGPLAKAAHWLVRQQRKAAPDPWVPAAGAAVARLLRAVDQPDAAARVEGLMAGAAGAAAGPAPWLPTAASPLPGGPAATVLSLVDDVAEEVGVDPAGIDLFPRYPADWLGQGVEVHGLPTVAGRLAFAVRWHGPRPALLWDLEPSAPEVPLRLTASGLDPGWSATATRGEALLAAPTSPEPATPPDGGFS